MEHLHTIHYLLQYYHLFLLLSSGPATSYLAGVSFWGRKVTAATKINQPIYLDMGVFIDNDNNIMLKRTSSLINTARLVRDSDIRDS